MYKSCQNASTRRPDVAVFIHSLSGGGAELIALTIANALVDEGKSVQLIVAAKKDAGHWSKLSPRVDIYDLCKPKVKHTLFPLMRHLRSYRPQILLTFLPEANIVGCMANAMAGSPSRVIVTEHALFSFFHKQMKLATRLRYQICLWSYFLAARLVGVSQAVADDIRSFVPLPKSKVDIIYNPVVRPELAALKTQPPEHEWLVSSEAPVFIAVGALRPEKNHGLLLEAFAELIATRNARLVILGEGSERAFLEEKIRQLNLSEHVALPGFVANPYACMAKATALVHSSDTEGLPNVITEALACGCPVIATDCPGGMREITGDGHYAILTAKGDKAALAKAMRDILENPAEAKRKTLAFQNERMRLFTSEEVIPRYLRLIEEISHA